jgi:penicillin-binding protein 2
MGDVYYGARRRKYKNKFFILTAIVVLSFFILVSYLFYLQVISSPKFKLRAREVASRVENIHARRGEIYDRNMDFPLVTNVDSFAIDLIPGKVPRGQMDEVFVKLSKLLGLDLEDIEKKINKRYYRNFQNFEIKNGVPREIVYYLAEHIQDFPGVTWRSKPRRSYLEKGSLSHVLGYVDNITTEEIQVLYNKGYSFNSTIGKSGIERYYDEVLRGKAGKKIKIVDVKEQQTREKTKIEIRPENGSNLILTIDRHIQKLCEKALGKRKGSVVVIKPATGELLALVSYPWFDPSIFTSESSSSDYREFALDPESPFLNRSIQSVYPPASVFKIILTTAVVEERVLPVSTIYECNGEMRLGDRIFHCWRPFGHGALDLVGGLANSCDIYFWNLGLKLGPDTIIRFAREYGLGSRTGIDLPGEVTGFLPSREWKEQKHHMKWLGGDTMNLSIGQGWTLVTPVQLANMVAMVVNEGIIYKPHVLGEIRDPETGNVIQKIEREVIHQSYISKNTFTFVQQAMRQVVIDGTARGVITTKAVVSAGKTGTAEIGLEEDYHSWYVGYAPYETEKPEERIIVAVMVEASVGGYEWWSPKAANAILQGIFADQTYEEAADTLNLWYLKQNGENQ